MKKESQEKHSDEISEVRMSKRKASMRQPIQKKKARIRSTSDFSAASLDSKKRCCEFSAAK